MIMTISLIAWMSKNRTIWKNNNLPWNYPEDLQYFRKTTNWHPVVMWLSTYYSIWKPLPNRRNIVLSRQELEIEGIEIFHSIPELIKTLKSQNDDKEIFIIWWASIYNQFLDFADKIYLTEIKKDYEQLIGRKVHKTTIYRLLKRHNWQKIMHRSYHPKLGKKLTTM